MEIDNLLVPDYIFLHGVMDARVSDNPVSLSSNTSKRQTRGITWRNEKPGIAPTTRVAEIFLANRARERRREKERKLWERGSRKMQFIDI